LLATVLKEGGLWAGRALKSGLGVLFGGPEKAQFVRLFAKQFLLLSDSALQDVRFRQGGSFNLVEVFVCQALLTALRLERLLHHTCDSAWLWPCNLLQESVAIKRGGQMQTGRLGMFLAQSERSGYHFFVLFCKGEVSLLLCCQVPFGLDVVLLLWKKFVEKRIQESQNPLSVFRVLRQFFW
jgi:hypothetical protein